MGSSWIKGQKRSKPSCKSLGSLSQRVTHLYSTSMDANSPHFRMGPPRVSQPQKGHPVGVLTYSNPLPKKHVLKTSKKLKTLKKNGPLGRATVPWSLKGIGVCETAQVYNQRNSEFKFLARVISRKFRI